MFYICHQANRLLLLFNLFHIVSGRIFRGRSLQSFSQYARTQFSSLQPKAPLAPASELVQLTDLEESFFAELALSDVTGLKAGLRKGQEKTLLLLAALRLGAGFSRQELTWKQLDCKVHFINTVLYSQSERDTHETISHSFIHIFHGFLYTSSMYQN